MNAASGKILPASAAEHVFGNVNKPFLEINSCDRSANVESK